MPVAPSDITLGQAQQDAFVAQALVLQNNIRPQGLVMLPPPPRESPGQSDVRVPEELAEQGRQAAKKEESPMAGTVASSSAPGTGGRVASEAVLIAGPPPMAAPDWAPDAEDEMAKQKIRIRKFKTTKFGQGDWKVPANLRIDFQCFAGGDCAIGGSNGKVTSGGQRENSSIGRESKSTTRSNGV